MEAYILQTFHILQNFKGCQKTNWSGRFRHKLVIITCSEVSDLWQPFFWEERKIEKKLDSNRKSANHKADSVSYSSVIGNLQNMKKLQNIFYDSTVETHRLAPPSWAVFKSADGRK